MGGSYRHAAVLNELVEWWQDLPRTKSRVVLLPVPPGWGRTHLLDQLAKIVIDDESLSSVIPVHGVISDELGIQAEELRKQLSRARVSRPLDADEPMINLVAEHKVAKFFGVDEPGGGIQLVLDIGGLFASPLAAGVAVLLANLTVGGVAKLWDTSAAGQEGMVAKLARAIATMSASIPVLVTIDDADRLKLDLSVVLIENLIERVNGQVLVIAAVDPCGDLVSALTTRARYGPAAGHIGFPDVDPDMDYHARVSLAADLCPNLPDIATRRIARRTRTFAEVFAVAESDLLSELDRVTAIEESVDRAIDAKISRIPSALAVVLGWAGGVLHIRQAERAIYLIGGQHPGMDSDVVRFASLVRVADLASPRLAEQVGGLSIRERGRLAEVVLNAAVEIGEDAHASLVEKVVAWQAAHRKRVDLQDRMQVVGVQCQLVAGLERLGDRAAAYQVAREALAEYRASQSSQLWTPEHAYLSAALLRLAQISKFTNHDTLIDETITAATTGSPAVGLEARIWAAVDLLAQPEQRVRALELIDQINTELDHGNYQGAIGNRWRELLALHAGRAGYVTISQQLLAPILDTPELPADRETAKAVLRAVNVLYEVDAATADIRLQVICLEAELEALQPMADSERLRLHYVLGADYDDLGDYPRALYHSKQELPLRERIRGIDHRSTLETRGRIAGRIGRCGRPTEALRLFVELLRDQQRVLGPNHPDTLLTRNNVAALTGESGQSAEALQLLISLLPDQERVLGPSDPYTLLTRYNIAAWTERCGRPAEALRLFQGLFPDQERVLGPDDIETLRTRSYIAGLIRAGGQSAEALRLFQDLLDDRQRVLGLSHPLVLHTRSDIASLVGERGQAAEALRLFQELLPDHIRVLGPDHPNTLTIRSNIASWTEKCGQTAEALQLLNELLPDQQRILGTDDPIILITRYIIAVWTRQCGDSGEALRLLQELLPDQERVFGSDDPRTMITNYDIAALTAESGHTAKALWLFQEQLAFQVQVLGPDHPHTLRIQDAIQRLMG